MTKHERELAAIARLRAGALAGDDIAAANIAASYRVLRRPRNAFRWWKRAADAGNGSAMLDVAYCYQHGAGVRRNINEAQRFYVAAIHSDRITPFEQEEAMYLLSVLLLATRPLPRADPRLS